MYTVPAVTPANTSNLASWTDAALSTSAGNYLPAPVSGSLPINGGAFTPMIIVGSDASGNSTPSDRVSGFGTGGTSQIFTVQPHPSPLPPGCSNSPSVLAGPLQYIDSISTSLTECGLATVQFKQGLNVSGAYVFLDTVIPLRQSTRMLLNTSTLAGLRHSWQLPVIAGTVVSFALSSESGLLFASPLLTVQPGNTSCIPTNVSAPSQPQSAAAADRSGTLYSSLLILVQLVLALVLIPS
ncbi:hypothetical protein CALCODRAFT_504972 [Calocera cornea HHB12733]|uniref:Uncharacterized protein n=1 Tax=Calocera cornea HHB12733 TaxID=1353952 RepID=A0A165C3L7_9BASI|nr:hypothetical protein CALCODRAFT_504972 [Calocera cornea HHB12733]